jgi:hypothetical protein
LRDKAGAAAAAPVANSSGMTACELPAELNVLYYLAGERPVSINFTEDSILDFRERLRKMSDAKSIE